MMPNMDPKALKKMMERMGIKNTDIDAQRVIIEGTDKDIVIDNPQVTLIEAQGMKSFQIVGDTSERPKIEEKIEISDDDVKMVMEKAGTSDAEAARKALEESNGDIAEAIMKLKEES